MSRRADSSEIVTADPHFIPLWQSQSGPQLLITHFSLLIIKSYLSERYAGIMASEAEGG